MGQRHVCTFRHAQRVAYRTAISAAQTCLYMQTSGTRRSRRCQTAQARAWPSSPRASYAGTTYPAQPSNVSPTSYRHRSRGDNEDRDGSTDDSRARRTTRRETTSSMRRRTSADRSRVSVTVCRRTIWRSSAVASCAGERLPASLHGAPASGLSRPLPSIGGIDRNQPEAKFCLNTVYCRNGNKKWAGRHFLLMPHYIGKMKTQCSIKYSTAIEALGQRKPPARPLISISYCNLQPEAGNCRQSRV